jgi:serine/threonine protein kinase
MLKIFSNDAHPHLISLLVTYEYLKVYYLIFPWADGHLYEFWSTIEPEPIVDYEKIMWVAKQSEGIASGLLKVHTYQTSELSGQKGSHHTKYGRHGDLKPENILWFSDEDGGTLKISDFGLSEYNTIQSKSMKPRSKVATSASYRPPECDTEGGTIGPSFDIWTLGCLYLEFITWLIGGWALVQQFSDKRMSTDPGWYVIETDTFFELVQCSGNKHFSTGTPRLKSAVVKVTKHVPKIEPLTNPHPVYASAPRTRALHRISPRVHQHDPT